MALAVVAAALGLFFASAYTAWLRFAYQRTLRAMRLMLAIAILAGVIFAVTGAGATLFIALMTIFGCVFAIGAAVQARHRHRQVCRWRDDPNAALLLESPFLESWMVAAGGPFSRNNHHMTIPGERFAYDIIVEHGESLGRPILAPIGGVVEDARDGMADGRKRNVGRDTRGVEWRYGNFVSIRVDDYRVMCCHLRQHSVRVEIGQTVVAGQPIGDCGNSGRSYGPHLHVHAQDRPACTRGEGVPIAFRSSGVAVVPLPGDIVPGAKSDGDTNGAETIV